VKVLLVGAGTVGEAIAKLSEGRSWLERMVVADYDLDRARRVVAAVGGDVHVAARIDASSRSEVVGLAREHDVDLVMNAVDPQFLMPVFEAALEADCDYVDMAMSLSEAHPTEPHSRPGLKLGDRQFERAAEWESRGRLALVGMGMDPGLSDVFAAWAAKHRFDTVEEVHVRDGGDLRIEGFPFATVFSIWTTIEECLNPPVVWEDGAWRTLEPFAEPEMFPFPEGVGPVECVHVEHEEVLLVPRWIPARKVTFKYALGSDFIDVLQMLHRMGLDRKDPVRVKGVDVAPRDVVAALTPDPATIGEHMVGRAIVGTWVIGQRDGRRAGTYLYQACDAQETMREFGLQPVAWQTGFNPVLAMELLAQGVWSGAGVLGPEAFDPDPYLELMDRYGIHRGEVVLDPTPVG
jgi:saccharopine dehydrogenase-like NADP-dependent oxidoreductase